MTGGPRVGASTPPELLPFARLMLETLPQEARIGLTLGFVRTFGVPEIAGVLYGTGRMTSEPKARAKATGAAMFALLAAGTGTPEGRGIVEGLRRAHRRPGITPELMRYVLACFTVCPVRFAGRLVPGAVTPVERASAYAFHRSLALALDLPETGDGLIGDGLIGDGLIGDGLIGDGLIGDGLIGDGLIGDGLIGAAPPGPPATPPATPDALARVDLAMREFERERFGATAQAARLWEACSGALVAARLPGALAPLAPAVAGALLDVPLAGALGVRRPPAVLRSAVFAALRHRAVRHARAADVI